MARAAREGVAKAGERGYPAPSRPGPSGAGGGEEAMTARAALSALLTELGALTGVGGLSVDGAEGCALAFADRLVIRIGFEAETGLALLSVELGPAPDAAQAALLASMLAANLDGRETAGGALAIDGRRGAAVLLRRVDPLHLTAGELEGVLEILVAAGERWRERLAAAGAPDGVLQGGRRA
jgi:hypothetical protein